MSAQLNDIDRRAGSFLMEKIRQIYDKNKNLPKNIAILKIYRCKPE